MTSRPVESLFAPASVAVVGASPDRTSWGYQLGLGALAGRSTRRVHLVNRRAGDLAGVRFVPSLAAIGEPVELVVVAVPPDSFPSVVDDALAAGARAVVGVTAGLTAACLAGVSARVRAAGAILLGPNCMGVFDAATHLRLLWGDLPSGAIALISQSGNLALELGSIAARAGLGFSRFASIGDAADVTAVELLRAMVAHEPTRAVALYLESVGDGRSFLAAASAAIDAGKPVVLLAAGRSTVGAAAARSHTGALAPDAAVLAAACRDAGIILVATPTELVEATRVAALHRPLPPPSSVPPSSVRGPVRLGIVGDGGGHGIVAADLAVARGLSVPRFSAALANRLASGLPATAATTNPVDLAGGGERDLTSYARAVRTVAGSGEVDAVLLTGYFGGYAEQDPALAPLEARVADEIAGAEVPVFVHTMASGSVTAAHLTRAGVPTWPAIEHAVLAMTSLRPAGASAGTAPVPRPASVSARAPAGSALEAAGVRSARAVSVSTLAQAREAAARIGYPVVLKVTGVAHKSDVDGVALDLTDEAALTTAWEAMADRLAPPGFTVAEMVRRPGVEMFVGGRQDPSFGPVVVLGMGGVLAELIADTVVALAPVDRATAQSMVDKLRGTPLLRGYRGRPAVDEAALVDVIVAVAGVIAVRPDLSEVDLNPVLVTPDGAIALDLHIEEGRA